MLKFGYCKWYSWIVALCGAEIGIVRKIDQKYQGSFEMCCWRRMEKSSWTDRVRNEEVLHREKEQRNILHTVERKKGNWICYILCRNWLITHIIEGKIEGMIEVMGRRGIRLRQLLDCFKEK